MATRTSHHTRKTVLITGGLGFIGSHLCDALLAQGHEIIVLDDLSSGALTNLAPETQRQVRVIVGSVLDIASLAGEIGAVDHVFHLAALISGYDSLNAPDEYIKLNINALMRVMEFVRDSASRRDAAQDRIKLSFASSSTVYGDSSSHLRSEQLVPAPMTMYALSKLAGEHMLEMYHALYDFEYVALRLFNVYGPRQNPSHLYANVTCKFSQAAALGWPIKRYGDGVQTRDFVYVDDVIRAFLATMSPTPKRLYNVGTGEDHAINDLIETLEALSGRAFKIEQCPPWPNDIRRIRADIDRLQADVDWAPQTSLEQGLKATMDYFAAQEQ